MKKAICVIPARGGSTRIPRKNIKRFLGKPVIEYGIMAAQLSDVFGDIFVSTDDREIGEIIVDCGCRLYKRPVTLAKNEVGTFAVTKDFVEDYLVRFGEFEYICTLYPTNVFVTATDLQTAYRLLDASDADHVISITYPPLADAGMFYFSRVSSIMEGRGYFDFGTTLYPVPNNVDINYPDDWSRAEELYQQIRNGK